MKYLQDVLKSIIQSSADLNNKMRSIFLEKSQRSHYIFTLQTLTTLFRHVCVSIAPDCTKEQLLILWRHECDWLYGKKLISQVDVERYQQVFKTVIKKNFNNTNYLSFLNKQVFFSNLKETESGIVVAGMHISNSLASNNKEFTTDGYEPETNLIRIRNLIQISLNEYNKEQQRIQFPLYESTLALVGRLCHTIPILGGNCCIIGDGGLSIFLVQLVASLTGYHIVNFKTSQFLYNEKVFFQQLKHKLVSSYYRAGIRVSIL
jgi:dynein heavy chain